MKTQRLEFASIALLLRSFKQRRLDAETHAMIAHTVANSEGSSTYALQKVENMLHESQAVSLILIGVKQMPTLSNHCSNKYSVLANDAPVRYLKLLRVVAEHENKRREK